MCIYSPYFWVFYVLKGKISLPLLECIVVSERMRRDATERFKVHRKRGKGDRDTDDETKYAKWIVLPNESYKWDFIL